MNNKEAATSALGTVIATIAITAVAYGTVKVLDRITGRSKTALTK